MVTSTITKINIFGFMLLMASFTVSATVYKVGDSYGWTTKDPYHDWFESKEFHVGDSLVFEYDNNLNDVTQVSGALEFEFCDSSNPKAVYRTGHDVVTLTEPGYHYFISSNHAQCTLGQRFSVLAVHDPSLPISPPPPSNNLPFGKFYKVGDSKGWNVNESDYYEKWSQKKQFHVGDRLFFEYDNEANDVYEISGDLEFVSCDPISPVAVHKTGHDLITLTKPGVHYFISSKTGQCAAGLKLRVVVGPIPDVPKVLPTIDERLTSWLRSFIPHHH